MNVPPLQFLYAHHHVEVTLRILLNDITNIVRLSGLLCYTHTRYVTIV